MTLHATPEFPGVPAPHAGAPTQPELSLPGAGSATTGPASLPIELACSCPVCRHRWLAIGHVPARCVFCESETVPLVIREPRAS